MPHGSRAYQAPETCGFFVSKSQRIAVKPLLARTALNIQQTRAATSWICAMRSDLDMKTKTNP